MKKFLLSNTKVILILVLILGVLLRAWHFNDRFIFLGESNHSLYMLSDFMSGAQSRLLGFEATGYTHHLFLSPWYLYLITPFFILIKGEPLQLAYFQFIVGIFTMLIIYAIGKKFINEKTALLSTLIYAVWDRPIMIEKVIWAISLITFFSSLIMYFLLVAEKNKKTRWYIFLGAILGVSLSLHYQMIIPIVLIIIRTWWLNKKSTIYLIIPLIISWIPMLIFDLRNNFFNTTGLFLAAKTILSGGSPYSSAHYLLFLYIPFVLILGYFASKIKWLAFAPLLFLLIWWNNITILDQPSQSYITAERTVAKILDNYHPNMKVNFMGPDSYNYRYLLSLRSKNKGINMNKIHTFDPWSLDSSPDLIVKNEDIILINR